MVFDKTWRETRKAKKEAKRDPYDSEEIRLKLMLMDMDPRSDEYRRIKEEIASNNHLRKESIESRRRVPIEIKGNVVLKVLGLAGAGIGLFGIIKAEKDGLTFTGEKRSTMDAIARGIGQIFVHH